MLDPAAFQKLLTRRGVLIAEEEGSSHLADGDTDSDDARTRRPLQAAACTYRIALGRALGRRSSWCKVRCRAMPRSRRSFVPTCRVSACTPLCVAPPMTDRHFSNCAGTSRVRRWPTSVFRSTAPSRRLSSTRPHGAMAPRTS